MPQVDLIRQWRLYFLTELIDNPFQVFSNEYMQESFVTTARHQCVHVCALQQYWSRSQSSSPVQWLDATSLNWCTWASPNICSFEVGVRVTMSHRKSNIHTMFTRECVRCARGLKNGFQAAKHAALACVEEENKDIISQCAGSYQVSTQAQCEWTHSADSFVLSKLRLHSLFQPLHSHSPLSLYWLLLCCIASIRMVAPITMVTYQPPPLKFIHLVRVCGIG